MSTFYAIRNKKTGQFASLFNFGTEVIWTDHNSFKLFEKKEELEDLIAKAREYRRFRGIKLWHRRIDPRDIETISVEERYMECGRCAENKPAFVTQYCDDCEDAEEQALVKHYSLTNRLRGLPENIRWNVNHWIACVKAGRKLKRFAKKYGLTILKTPKGCPDEYEDGSTGYSYPQIKERIVGDNPHCRFIWSHGVGDKLSASTGGFESVEFDPSDEAACLAVFQKIGFSAHEIAVAFSSARKKA